MRKAEGSANERLDYRGSEQGYTRQAGLWSGGVAQCRVIEQLWGVGSRYATN